MIVIMTCLAGRMEKASDTAGLNHRRLSLAVATVVVTFMLMAAAASSADPTPKDKCVITANDRQWPCNRTVEDLTGYTCNIEDRMGNHDYSMFFNCDDGSTEIYVDDGETLKLTYASVLDPVAPRPPSDGFTFHRTVPTVTCKWRYAGNYMNGVVIWDERWPEAWSCRDQGGDGPCTLLFQNKEVTLVTGKGGRRVLGDIAIKECSKNWYGFGGWLPGGLGCTYQEHAHEYVGEIGSFY